MLLGMSVDTPAPGMTRYLCPLECGWHLDVPPLTFERIAALGVTADPAARDIDEAVTSVAHRATFAEAEQTEAALREHLGTHTTEQFVCAIHELRVEVAALRERPVSSDPPETPCACGDSARSRIGYCPLPHERHHGLCPKQRPSA